MNNKTLTFTIDEFDVIKKEYPKTLIEFSKHISEDLEAMAGEKLAPADLSEIVRSIISYSPRTLYDYFDEKRISPYAYMLGSKWKYGVGSVINEKEYDTRLAAEKDSIFESFEKRESNL